MRKYYRRGFERGEPTTMKQRFKKAIPIDPNDVPYLANEAEDGSKAVPVYAVSLASDGSTFIPAEGWGSGEMLMESKSELDATDGVITFSEPIEFIEIYT